MAVLRAISHAFSADPDGRRGLLPVLAGLACAGNDCDVPRRVLAACRCWGDEAKADAGLLTVARSDCTHEETTEAARTIAEAASSATVIWRSLELVRNKGDVEQSASFPLALLKHLPKRTEDAYQKIPLALSALAQYLGKRPSRLDDPEVWQRLRLPEKV